jgi:hypothetical protein
MDDSGKVWVATQIDTARAEWQQKANVLDRQIERLEELLRPHQAE